MFGDDGTFEVVLRATGDRRGGGAAPNRVALEPDAVCVVTRDYHADPASCRRAEWSITASDPSPAPRPTDAETAARFRATTNFLRELTGLCPLPYDESKWNSVDDPYPVPAVTYGWAAGDACYAMGAFQLAEGEALLIEGRSPKCAFWNLCLWNPYLQTYDYRFEPTTINGEQVAYESDGSWRIVVCERDPGVANWVATAGHARGRIWLRWFLADELPARPTTRVVRTDELSWK